MTATRQTPLTAFHAPHAPDDDRLISAFSQKLVFSGAQDRAIDARATKLIQAIRSESGQMGGVEDFLREYGLSTREGLALMVLAEALLRVPDAMTQDRLIEDKLKEGGWSDHETHGDTWFVSASAWALAMSARVISPGETPEGVMRGLVKRMGMPTVRTATRQAMRFLGHHFVLGETIEDALSRAAKNEMRGYRHSYDMLGEGARTLADAKRYFKSYADAIAAIGKAAGRTAAGRKLPDRPGISVKLSALHPRYLATHREQVLEELVPDLVRLAQMAKAHDLNFTVDAEEVDRLELSLDVIDRAFADPSLAGWDGFGLAIQAYQKRAPQVIDHIAGLCRQHGRRMMVRLVKGAYWDTEIKRAQERGLDGYGVFTRKAATDLSYLACARRMLDMRDVIYPQFATHNALTVATIIEMAEDRSGFEFQRLHGMGEVVYESLHSSNDRVPCRIYAPVGGYRDLLAYLVRRLLENGANSSFVAVAGDKTVPIESLLERPDAKLGLARGQSARNSQIPLPSAIYPDRANSRGLEFGDRLQLASLIEGMARSTQTVEAGPLAPGLKGGAANEVRSPSDPGNIVGTVRFTDPRDVDKAVTTAAEGFRSWSRTDPGLRAAALDRAADLLEDRRDRFMALLSAEAGKTLDDGIAEIREAVDFLRYYAARSRDMFSIMLPMPAPTGEDNRLGWRGRGVFVCISPWNFPLAIFLGQVSAGLAAGNAVIAKPAEQTPLIAHEAIKLLHEAGVPKNVLLCLPGAGDVGAALTAHPRIGGVAFTGSTETARAIVQEDVADHMLAMIEGAARELKLGNPAKPSTDVGPVIDAAQREMLAAHIATISKTQKLVYAGDAPNEGLFFAPHIVELKDASALDREIFGPVLHVVRYKAKKLDAVLDAIDATGFGLTLGVHSRIEATVRKVIDRLDTGNVYINRNMIGAVVGTQPFGGSGLSGTGFKAGGPHYLMRFAVEQAVSVNTAAAGGNAGLIAMGDG